MKEFGGYIELDTYHLPMLHDDGIALNCGRNCLAYLFKSRGIRKLKIPYFICSSIIDVCDRENVGRTFYHIGTDFRPEKDMKLEEDEWLYLVNFYGQLSNNDIQEYVDRYKRVIVDQANGYFEEPLLGVDTIYTSRKWFGVADGAFLYTDTKTDVEFPCDESFERMRFILGRYERTASEFYAEYQANNSFFKTEPIKKMSRLTANLLHGIDYEGVERQREENFKYLDRKLGHLNKLSLKTALFMYPFMVQDGDQIRKNLIKKKIYIPVLWPTVFEVAEQGTTEYEMAKNILPLPVDQRYSTQDMEYLVQEVLACIN